MCNATKYRYMYNNMYEMKVCNDICMYYEIDVLTVQLHPLHITLQN